uniref:Fe/B12 periplasmic-binding domain-containing protein n=1 Tax=Elaeophora elaphi TaxID=1147741 RepID=A0A0R3S085_9BILA
MPVDSLSKVQPDLLMVDSSKQLSQLLPLNGTESLNQTAAVYKKDLQAPKHVVTNRNDHELLSEHSRMRKTVANVVDGRRMIGGNAHAEHFVRELKAASLINRGPPGISHSSHLHWDLLLGKDETIDPCDYLNFDYTAKF